MANDKVPTLLVGLGGIGGSIVDKIGRLLSPEQSRYTGLVALDTNVNDLNLLKSPKTIWIGQDGIVKTILAKNLDYLEWFPSNRWVNNKDVKNGAGQVRAIARLTLAATGRDDRNALVTIDQEIDRILKNDGEVNISQFNVFITGSITGGTGAGTFLQIPYYIRDYIKRRYSATNIMIRGMFVGPDITAPVNPSKINSDAVKINAYTCLKELNAFYLSQIKEDRFNHLQLEYYEKKDRFAAFDETAEKMMSLRCFDNLTEEEYSKRVAELAEDGANIPYDSFYLAEGAFGEGGVGNVSLETIKTQISKTIFTLLFTPVRPRAAGVEDNGILLDMRCSGMNRYSSAGFCALRYPYEQIKEYIALSYCKKMVNEEWLILDNLCDMEKTDALNQQKSDPRVSIPGEYEMYTKYFEDQTSGKDGTKLGHLRKDAFVENQDKTYKYLKKIEEQMTSYIDTDVIRNEIESCEIIDINKMKKSAEEASAEINNVLPKVEMLTRKMIDIVETRKREVANEVFPENYDSMMMHKDSPLSVYSLLHDVHPLAGRYLCYKMILALQKKLADVEKDEVTISELSEYKYRDYSEKEGRQSLEDDIRDSWNKKKLRVFPAKKEAGIYGFTRLDEFVSEQITRIREYGRTQIRIPTYRMLLRRFEQLAEHYEAFFESIRTSIQANDEFILNLERSYIENPFGERIIYGSPEAFRASFEEFTRSADFQLPATVNDTVFLGLYKQTCNLLTSKESLVGADDAIKKIEKQVKNRISGMFRTHVMAKMTSYVEKKGNQHFDLSIKDALAKEMGLTNGIFPADDDFDMERIKYTREKIEQAMKAAAPMLAVTPDAANISENVYLAMNLVSAEMEGAEPSLPATENRLVPDRTDGTDYEKVCVILDEGFSKYEMICLKVRHKYLAEHLAKYAPGSEYERLYRERIIDVGKEPVESDMNAYMTVITPHLNRFWHESGYIPGLTLKERKEFQDKILKAFVYSMGMDLFMKETTEGIKEEKWTFITRSRSHRLVTESSMPINNAYVDLYYSLENNVHMVSDILERAKSSLEENRKRLGILLPEKLIEEQDLLVDLIEGSSDPNDMNYFDLLEKMIREEYMDPSDWGQLFRGLYITLKEYLWTLLNGNKKLVNEIYQETITRIYNNSSCGRKDADAKAGKIEWNPDLIERKIKENYEDLKEARIFY